MMHIAMLSRGFGKTAGIWRVATDLTEAYLARGHRVTYFCAPPMPPAPDWGAGLDFRAIPVPARPYALRGTGGVWERLKKTINPVHPAIYALDRRNFSPRGSS